MTSMKQTMITISLKSISIDCLWMQQQVIKYTQPTCVLIRNTPPYIPEQTYREKARALFTAVKIARNVLYMHRPRLTVCI